MAVQAIVAYGVGQGFGITFEDADEAYRKLQNFTDDAERDLDDAELENVAGGVGSFGDFIIRLKASQAREREQKRSKPHGPPQGFIKFGR